MNGGVCAYGSACVRARVRRLRRGFVNGRSGAVLNTTQHTRVAHQGGHRGKGSRRSGRGWTLGEGVNGREGEGVKMVLFLHHHF